MPGERRTSIYLYSKAASFVVHLVRNLPAVVKQHLCFEVIRDVCLSRIAAATLESPNFGARLVVWAALVECELNQVGAIAELRVCNLVLRRAMSLSVWSTSDVGEDYDVVPSVLKLSERPATSGSTLWTLLRVWCQSTMATRAPTGSSRLKRISSSEIQGGSVSYSLSAFEGILLSEKRRGASGSRGSSVRGPRAPPGNPTDPCASLPASSGL